MDHRRRSAPASLPAQSLDFPAIAVSLLNEPNGPFISVATTSGTLAVRDAEPGDADGYVSYWHYSGERVKELLGIDRDKLGTADDTRERFLNMIRTPGRFQKNVVFSITLSGHVIGYTNINQHGPDDNYAHLHTYRASLYGALKSSRSRHRQRTGYGIAAVLAGPIIAMYFGLYPIRRVILQTRPGNSAINKALDLYLLKAERTYVDHPGGLAAPGEQFLRYVRREELPQLLERAGLLAKSMKAPGSDQAGRREPVSDVASEGGPTYQ